MTYTEEDIKRAHTLWSNGSKNIDDIIQSIKHDKYLHDLNTDKIIDIVKSYYGISEDAICRHRNQNGYIMYVAFLAYWYSRERLNEIGKRLDGRDHSTILYYFKQVMGFTSVSNTERKKVLSIIEHGKKLGYKFDIYYRKTMAEYACPKWLPKKLIKMKKYNTIYLDIETYYSEERPSVQTEFTAPSNYKDPVKIAEYIEAKKAQAEKDNFDEWMKTALDPIDGRIYCIAVALNDEDPIVFADMDERNVLMTFEEFLTTANNFKIVAHNGNGFDYPFIFLKSLKYKLEYLRRIFSGQTPGSLFDTMELLYGTSRYSKNKNMVSLDRASKLIGRSGKGEITGKDVPLLIYNGEGDKVASYCKEDVEDLRALWKALGQDVYD